MYGFEKCANLEEAKKLYKKLARENHPDLGGSADEMKRINAEWDNFLKSGCSFKDEAEKASGEKYAEIINVFIKYDVTIDIVGSWIWITGNTYSIKDELKRYGFKWASKKKAWYMGESTGKHSKMTLDQIKEKYGCNSFKGHKANRLCTN